MPPVALPEYSRRGWGPEKGPLEAEAEKLEESTKPEVGSREPEVRSRKKHPLSLLPPSSLRPLPALLLSTSLLRYFLLPSDRFSARFSASLDLPSRVNPISICEWMALTTRASVE